MTRPDADKPKKNRDNAYWEIVKKKKDFPINNKVENYCRGVLCCRCGEPFREGHGKMIAFCMECAKTHRPFMIGYAVNWDEFEDWHKK